MDVGDGVVLDGWMLKPAPFDPSRRYPLIVFVYGEPANVTAADRWGGAQTLFHRALAQAGYVVVSFDNRGTPALKGASWRKVVYGAVGELSSKEQARRSTSSWAGIRSSTGTGSASGDGAAAGRARCTPCSATPTCSRSASPWRRSPTSGSTTPSTRSGIWACRRTTPTATGAARRSHFAEGLRGKLLLIHGSGDDNVHYQGTERLVNRLIELGKPFDLMVYPNRTHSISEGPGTSAHVYNRIARYFVEHLPPGPAR